MSAAIGSGAGRDAVIELRPHDEWHEDFGFALWYDLPIDEAPYVGSPLCDDWPGYHTHWCKLPDVAAPPSVRALASLEPPAQKIMDGLQDALAFAKGDTSKARVTSPAASDLGDDPNAATPAMWQEEIDMMAEELSAASDLREQETIDRWTGTIIDAYVLAPNDEDEKREAVARTVAAIRAEAKAEGWDDAVKALQGVARDAEDRRYQEREGTRNA